VLEHAAGDSPTTDNRPLTTLETTGREYYEFRAALMVRNNEGLTKTYNRFHDPDERSTDILQLRELHAAMDRAVLEAYDWHDLAQTATCDFLLDYEDDEEEKEPTGRARRRKKTWRYRWPDDFRDEVLARLLALNAQRAEQERLRGVAAEGADKGKNRKKSPAGSKSGKKNTDQQGSRECENSVGAVGTIELGLNGELANFGRKPGWARGVDCSEWRE
jgi:hypothetical protein